MRRFLMVAGVLVGVVAICVGMQSRTTAKDVSKSPTATCCSSIATPSLAPTASPVATDDGGATCATCTGDTPCNACKNCKYCKHCSKNGGKCGVCK